MMIIGKKIWIFCFFIIIVACTIHEEGYCAMYDNCGKKSIFGDELPCVSNIKAFEPSVDSVKLLQDICGKEFPIDTICCSEAQLEKLGSNLKKVDPLISSCPACRKNFYDFFCKFTCSPNQATFVNVTKTSISSNLHKEIVTELTQYVKPDYAGGFFNSCKEVKFSATNGYAMDLIGGGASNYAEFLKFLGDEKPLLGGSPFQINFKYDLTEEEAEAGLELRVGDTKSCDDSEYKCACSDCSSACPILPDFRDFEDTCKIGILPCFSFSIISIWMALIILIGAYHVYLSKTRKTPIDEYIEELEAIDSSIIVESEQYGFLKEKMISLQKSFIKSIEGTFEVIGLYCASFPALTIGISILVTALLSSGIYWLDIETDPVNLWVSPSEPALKNLQYYESKFGEFYRIEQIIVSSKDDTPILNWENIQWWFEKELELQELDGTFLSDLCFKPTGDACIIESFTQYFQGDIGYLNENNWKNELKSCADSPVNCLPIFQQPLKSNILFDNEDVLESKAFVITLLLNSNSSDVEYTEKAIRYEHSLRDWILSLKQDSNLRIDFSTEISLTEELNKSTNSDAKIIVLSYLFMFFYASLALGGTIPRNLKGLVKTRFQLGLGGIVIILLSVASSVGVCSIFGLKSTLIIAEVIPFLILAIGIDNIFLIIHELRVISSIIPKESVETRISRALGNIGPSCLISAILQTSMFLLATRVEMPAVKNFAYYSAGSILTNFLLQMTGFIALLSIDQRRLEEGRLDCFPWITIINNDGPIEDEGFKNDSFISNFIGRSYAPYILSKSNSKKILGLFVLWLGISLSLIPKIEFGLDQRIAIPSDSYLVGYFDSIYKHLNVGPPVFFVLKDLDLATRENQQLVCGKFSTCEEFSVANILEQEFSRVNKSTISEPASSWLDDFLTWLNPNLDQCCRFKKSSPLDHREFCSPFASDRTCETCYSGHEPPYSSTMEGFPVGQEFMFFFNQWIQEPSDPCPLGGKAPYSNSVYYTNDSIISSYFRTSHLPLRSQEDFITAYKNSLRIVDEIKSYNPTIDLFAHSPFYIFFVQYVTLAKLTFMLLGVAAVFIWGISTLLLGSIRAACILVVTVASILINIAGVLSLWSISLNAVTLVNLIICVGLAVEFTIHITRAYTSNTLSYEENHEALYLTFMSKDFSDGRTHRVYNVLINVGGSVLTGITFTKIIGVTVLAFTQSKIFEVYYFRMWASLVVIAAVHALCLLPILLALFGTTTEQNIALEDAMFESDNINEEN